MEIWNVGNRIVNTYIYQIEDGYIMIDTGYDNGLNKVLKKMEKNNLKPENIRYIFLTHAHDDHAGFINEIMNKFPKIKLICNSKSIEVLKKGQNPFEGGCSSKLALFFCNIIKIFGRGKHLFPIISEENLKRTISINEANKNEIEKILKGNVYDTPGHTKDSISLMLNDGKFFCGGASMNGLPSINKITIWIENKKEYVESWKKIISIRPLKIYPGHGKSFNYNCLENKINKLDKVKLLKLSEDSLLKPSVTVAELDTVLGMKKTHNIYTNYSQTLNRTKEDRIQGTTGMNTETKKDEWER